MKQVVQNYRTGDLWLEEVPVPMCRPGYLLVRNLYSVVSTGTERMKVDQARMSLLQKARARPDQVAKVLQTVKQVGITETLSKVSERLDSLTPLGYSSAGEIVEVGAGIDHLNVGDLVVCAGEGIACHAEYVCIPKNLCAKIPSGVEPSDAAFATVGAIAINGVRQAGVGLGDIVMVIGLGLVGLLAVQILTASGCRVIGVDLDKEKLALAKACGAEEVLLSQDESLVQRVFEISNGRGADAVYVSASSKSSAPLHTAAAVARDRATVAIVGMLPIEVEWQAYYEKELNVVLSRSYGPGRYDPNFERKGIGYPVGYVPWTQQRNLEEFVRLIASGAVSPQRLSPQLFAFENAPEAYEQIHNAPEKHVGGIVFEYPSAQGSAPSTRVVNSKPNAGVRVGKIGIGMIGAGNFATGTLIPALKSVSDAQLVGICSAGGLSAKNAANRHGFAYATSNSQELLADESIHAVVIATRHDSHASLAIEALRADKSVFVEKPLALSHDELQQLASAAAESKGILMPGFNRRFSPLSAAIKTHFEGEQSPLEIVCRVNAGAIGSDSWYQDPDEGGWRIVSEGCHWIDLLSYLADSLPEQVSAYMIAGNESGQQNDNCIATLQFANGSIATLCYLSNGDSGFEKERIEVFGRGKVGVINNWRNAELYQDGKRKKVSAAGSGKGHANELKAFVDAVRGGTDSPISLASAIATSAAALEIQQSMLENGAARTVS